MLLTLLLPADLGAQLASFVPSLQLKIQLCEHQSSRCRCKSVQACSIQSKLVHVSWWKIIVEWSSVSTCKNRKWEFSRSYLTTAKVHLTKKIVSCLRVFPCPTEFIFYGIFFQSHSQQRANMSDTENSSVPGRRTTSQPFQIGMRLSSFNLLDQSMPAWTISHLNHFFSWLM